ncbi:MAG: hypothetical protein KDE14_15260 [Rhodobacteraceae bacterium]|nr:hypothetical protein [Paracoccaceae bacterium]
MKRFSPPIIYVIAAALLLVACGSVPQPFRGTPKVTADRAILDIPSAVGIAVLPPEGVPDPLAGQLGDAIAASLAAYDIPAEAVRVNGGLGFSLTGKVSDISISNGLARVMIDWRLISRRGEPEGEYMQRAELPAMDWQTGGAAADRLGADVADAVLSMIDQASIVEPVAPSGSAATAAAPIYPSVSVTPVEGAPGNGREALQLAMIQTLALQGVKRDDVSPAVVLAGQVSVKPTATGDEFIEIGWRALRPDGSELGKISLTNTIPRGALDGSWGAAAFAIAEAALPDVMQVLSLVPAK